MSTIMELVFTFVKVAKDMQKDYVEAWLSGKVNDYDMDMYLIDERQARRTTYPRLANEIPFNKGVSQ